MATDNDGATRAFLEPVELSLTRRISTFAEALVKLDARKLGPGVVDVASRSIKLYRNETLRFFGRIGEPFEEDPDFVTIRAFDPYYWLAWRLVQLDVIQTEDAGVVAQSLIADQNARGPEYTTRLEAGALDPSPPRQIAVPRFKKVQEAIDELAQMEDSFFFRVDPVDDTPGVQGEFVVLYPEAGDDHADVRFEYGDGTLANLATYKRSRKVPVSLGVAVRQGGSVSESTLERTVGVPVGEFDHQELFITVPDAVADDVVRERAAELVFVNPPTLYEVTPSVGVGPVLFDDFQLGDTVRVTVKHGRIDDVLVPARVNEATVAWDGASERLTVALET